MGHPSFDGNARVLRTVDDTALFNGLPSLREANARLRRQIEQMGDASDFAALK